MTTNENAGLFAIVIGTGAFLLWLFFGGTVAILFSRRAPWQVRKRWTTISLVGAIALLAVGGIAWVLPGFGWNPLLIAVAALAAPINNWVAYERYKRSVTVTATGNAAPKSELDGTNRSAPILAKSPVSLWGCLAITLCLIVVPGLVAGPIFLAPLVALWAACAFALSFSARFASVRIQRLRNLAIYFFASVLVCVAHAGRLDTAHARGELLVSAIKKFQTTQQRYPSSLEDLVPNYIESVPVAAYGRYHYSNHAEVGPILSYFTFPPFGRRGYCFEGTRACALNFDNPSARNTWFDYD